MTKKLFITSLLIAFSFAWGISSSAQTPLSHEVHGMAYFPKSNDSGVSPESEEVVYFKNALSDLYQRTLYHEAAELPAFSFSDSKENRIRLGVALDHDKYGKIAILIDLSREELSTDVAHSSQMPVLLAFQEMNRAFYLVVTNGTQAVIRYVRSSRALKNTDIFNLCAVNTCSSTLAAVKTVQSLEKCRFEIK